MKYQFLSLSIYKLFSWFILFTIIITIHSCKDDPVKPPDIIQKVTLSTELVTSTEVFLNLKLENVNLPADFILFSDSLTLKTYRQINSADTTIYIDSLLPGKFYNFQMTNTTSEMKSNIAEVRTLDTTTHNFTSTTWTFGELGMSQLYDAAIINENNIWAVGLIYMKDSLGNPSVDEYYNAVHWNGNEWKLYRIKFYVSCGQNTLVSYEALTVFAFNETDVIIGGGGRQVVQLSDTLQVKIICAPFSIIINDLWGLSIEDFYSIGQLGGKMIHYKNGQLTRIETGTTVNFGEIIGVADHAGGYNKYISAGDTMLVINESNSIIKFIQPPYNEWIVSVWGLSDNLIYTAGDGVVLYKNEEWLILNNPVTNPVYRIKGNNYNNIFGIAPGSIVHFNGMSWQNIITGSPNSYYSLDTKDEITVAVGRQGDKAAITVLKRIS